MMGGWHRVGDACRGGGGGSERVLRRKPRFEFPVFVETNATELKNVSHGAIRMINALTATKGDIC